MLPIPFTNGNGHRWKFFRAGGFDQVRLESGADLAAIDQLDQKLWAALACPTQGLEFDSKTLALIDTDKDGRIRAPEMIAATKWAVSCLRNPDELLKGSGSLSLSAINDDTAEGKQLLSSARQILANLGKKDATAITVEDTGDTTKIFAQTVFNGDGIVPADSADEPMLKAVITEIIDAVGAEMDRSGKPGLNQARLDQFYADANTYVAWCDQAEKDHATIIPLGKATPAAAAAFNAVKVKVDDYFARCRLAAFDSRATAAVNRQESEYLAFVAKDMTITASEVAGFPLARIEAGKALPLTNGVNPAWAVALAKFQVDCVQPVLSSREAITEAEWQAIGTQLSAHNAWAASRPGAAVEKLGLKRLREIVSGNSKAAIETLIARDKALEPEANSIAAVDRLVRYNRDLYKLLNNFVAFRDFYTGKEKAVFQVGVLYLDQRSCELCLRVEDTGKHAAMAGLAGTYLAYCDCVRKATGEKMQIVAAFTGGDSDNLMPGRNGLFYDRKGRDWDATITRIVDNPISIRQAFWLPYKRFVRMIEEQVAKRAAAADAAATQKMQTAAQTTASVGAAAPKPPEPKKLDTGVVAALGVAVGAIGTAMSATVTGVLRLPGWQMPLVLLGLLLAISGPAMIIAWLKLRKRNLGPILDANGWAVNARAKVNLPFGASLTKVGVVPLGAERNLIDPFAENHSVRNRIIWGIILAALGWALWNFGGIERMKPGLLPKSKWQKSREAAALEKAAAQKTVLPPATITAPAAAASPVEVPK
jgi:hypothetical protein